MIEACGNWRYYDYDCNTKTTTSICPAGPVRGDGGKKYSERNLPHARLPRKDTAADKAASISLRPFAAIE